MRIMEITALPNGAHRNQLCDTCEVIPAGWAVVPDTLAVPNFPFGSATVEPCGGVATVTAWVPGVVPEAEDEPTEPSQAERLAALEAENTLLKAQVAAQSDQMDFYEECIAEMATVVYA